MINNILESSKLCYGPMSKNIVDSLIKYSNDTHSYYINSFKKTN